MGKNKAVRNFVNIGAKACKGDANCKVGFCVSSRCAEINGRRCFNVQVLFSTTIVVDQAAAFRIQLHGQKIEGSLLL